MENLTKKFESFWQKEQTGSKEETFWRSRNVYSSQKSLILPSQTICFNVEHCVLVPASV